MIARTVAVLVVLSACGGTEHGAQELGPLSFDVPKDWQRSDTRARGIATAVFAAGGDARKQTVTVIRSELSPAVAKAGAPTLARLLERAQVGFNGAHVSAITPISTKNGLAGMRVDVDYVPPGLARRYHRVHAVFADHGALVHVLYTALDPDPDLAAFDLVLRTLREES